MLSSIQTLLCRRATMVGEAAVASSPRLRGAAAAAFGAAGLRSKTTGSRHAPSFLLHKRGLQVAVPVFHSPSGHGHSHGDDIERAPPRPEDWYGEFALAALVMTSTRESERTQSARYISPFLKKKKGTASLTGSVSYVWPLLFNRWDARNQIAEDAADVMFIVVLSSGADRPSLFVITLSPLHICNSTKYATFSPPLTVCLHAVAHCGV